MRDKYAFGYQRSGSQYPGKCRFDFGFSLGFCMRLFVAFAGYGHTAILPTAMLTPALAGEYWVKYGLPFLIVPAKVRDHNPFMSVILIDRSFVPVYSSSFSWAAFRLRSMVIRETSKRSPIRLRLMFSRRNRAANCSWSGVNFRGGPNVLPSARALARPATVLRRIDNTSCCADQAMKLRSMCPRNASGESGSAAR